MTDKEFYLSIWEGRMVAEGWPRSEVSGKPLHGPGHSRFMWQFAHVLPKGAFPRYRHNPENIILLLPEEHEKQEDFAIFKEAQERLKARYYAENKPNT